MTAHLPLRFAIFAMVLFAVGCEQPLTRDANGAVHGTGELAYKYKSGAVKSRDYYERGMLVRSVWYKPDGTVLKETRWIDGAGEGLYLREDGSIRTRMQFVNGVAEGEAVEYDEVGNAMKVTYHAGQRVEKPSPATAAVK